MNSFNNKKAPFKSKFADTPAPSNTVLNVSAENMTKLYSLIEQGNVGIITDYLLGKSLDLNTVYNGNIILNTIMNLNTSKMSEDRKLEFIDFFVNRKKVNVNSYDDKGMTPLHVATKKGYVKIARFLLDKGAHVNTHNADGLSPLHYATLITIVDCPKENAPLAIIEKSTEPKVKVNKLTKDMIAIFMEKGQDINIPGPVDAPAPVPAMMHDTFIENMNKILSFYSKASDLIIDNLEISKNITDKIKKNTTSMTAIEIGKEFADTAMKTLGNKLKFPEKIMGSVDELIDGFDDTNFQLIDGNPDDNNIARLNNDIRNHPIKINRTKLYKDIINKLFNTIVQRLGILLGKLLEQPLNELEEQTKQEITTELPRAIKLSKKYDIPFDEKELTEIIKWRSIGSDHNYKISELYRLKKQPDKRMDPHGKFNDAELLHSILPDVNASLVDLGTLDNLIVPIITYYNIGNIVLPDRIDIPVGSNIFDYLTNLIMSVNGSLRRIVPNDLITKKQFKNSQKEIITMIMFTQLDFTNELSIAQRLLNLEISNNDQVRIATARGIVLQIEQQLDNLKTIITDNIEEGILELSDFNQTHNHILINKLENTVERLNFLVGLQTTFNPFHSIKFTITDIAANIMAIQDAENNPNQEESNAISVADMNKNILDSIRIMFKTSKNQSLEMEKFMNTNLTNDVIAIKVFMIKILLSHQINEFNNILTSNKKNLITNFVQTMEKAIYAKEMKYYIIPTIKTDIVTDKELEYQLLRRIYDIEGLADNNLETYFVPNNGVINGNRIIDAFFNAYKANKQAKPIESFMDLIQMQTFMDLDVNDIDAVAAVPAAAPAVPAAANMTDYIEMNRKFNVEIELLEKDKWDKRNKDCNGIIGAFYGLMLILLKRYIYDDCNLHNRLHNDITEDYIVKQLEEYLISLGNLNNHMNNNYQSEIYNQMYGATDLNILDVDISKIINAYDEYNNRVINTANDNGDINADNTYTYNVFMYNNHANNDYMIDSGAYNIFIKTALYFTIKNNIQYSSIHIINLINISFVNLNSNISYFNIIDKTKTDGTPMYRRLYDNIENEISMYNKLNNMISSNYNMLTVRNIYPLHIPIWNQEQMQQQLILQITNILSIIRTLQQPLSIQDIERYTTQQFILYNQLLQQLQPPLLQQLIEPLRGFRERIQIMRRLGGMTQIFSQLMTRIFDKINELLQPILQPVQLVNNFHERLNKTFITNINYDENNIYPNNYYTLNIQAPTNVINESIKFSNITIPNGSKYAEIFAIIVYIANDVANEISKKATETDIESYRDYYKFYHKLCSILYIIYMLSTKQSKQYYDLLVLELKEIKKIIDKFSIDKYSESIRQINQMIVGTNIIDTILTNKSNQIKNIYDVLFGYTEQCINNSVLFDRYHVAIPKLKEAYNIVTFIDGFPGTNVDDTNKLTLVNDNIKTSLHEWHIHGVIDFTYTNYINTPTISFLKNIQYIKLTTNPQLIAFLTNIILLIQMDVNNDDYYSEFDLLQIKNSEGNDIPHNVSTIKEKLIAFSNLFIHEQINIKDDLIRMIEEHFSSYYQSIYLYYFKHQIDMTNLVFAPGSEIDSINYIDEQFLKKAIALNYSETISKYKLNLTVPAVLAVPATSNQKLIKLKIDTLNDELNETILNDHMRSIYEQFAQIYIKNNLNHMFVEKIRNKITSTDNIEVPRLDHLTLQPEEYDFNSNDFESKLIEFAKDNLIPDQQVHNNIKLIEDEDFDIYGFENDQIESDGITHHIFYSYDYYNKKVERECIQLNTEIITLLLEKNANVRDTDMHGKTIIDYMIEGSMHYLLSNPNVRNICNKFNSIDTLVKYELAHNASFSKGLEGNKTYPFILNHQNDFIARLKANDNVKKNIPINIRHVMSVFFVMQNIYWFRLLNKTNYNGVVGEVNGMYLDLGFVEYDQTMVSVNQFISDNYDWKTVFHQEVNAEQILGTKKGKTNNKLGKTDSVIFRDVKSDEKKNIKNTINTNLGNYTDSENSSAIYVDIYEDNINRNHRDKTFRFYNKLLSKYDKTPVACTYVWKKVVEESVSKPFIIHDAIIDKFNEQLSKVNDDKKAQDMLGNGNIDYQHPNYIEEMKILCGKLDEIASPISNFIDGRFYPNVIYENVLLEFQVSAITHILTVFLGTNMYMFFMRLLETEMIKSKINLGTNDEKLTKITELLAPLKTYLLTNELKEGNLSYDFLKAHLNFKLQNEDDDEIVLPATYFIDLYKKIPDLHLYNITEGSKIIDQLKNYVAEYYLTLYQETAIALMNFSDGYYRMTKNQILGIKFIAELDPKLKPDYVPP